MVCKETVENRFRFNGQQYEPVSWQYYMRARFYNPVYYIAPSGHYVCASGVERRIEDVRRRTATRDEYKSLSSHLREKNVMVVVDSG